MSDADRADRNGVTTRQEDLMGVPKVEGGIHLSMDVNRSLGRYDRPVGEPALRRAARAAFRRRRIIHCRETREDGPDAIARL